MARILVTGAGGPAGTAVVEHLRRSRHLVVAADAAQDTAGQRLADTAAQLPFGNDPLFSDAAVELVAEHGIDVLVPTLAEELVALHENAARLLELGCSVLLPEPAAVEACLDKYVFAQLCARYGVPAPATVLPGELLPPAPWIVKPRRGRGSRGVHPAESETAARLAAESHRGSVVQSRLPGREFTVDVLCGPDRRVVLQVPRWREEVRGGISSAGTAFRSPAIERAVERLVEILGFRGMANVQGCQAPDGSFAFFEMNPRFSGGLPISLAAGADFVEAYIALAAGRPVPAELCDWEPGHRVVRYLTQSTLPRSSLAFRPPATQGARAGRRRILIPLGTRPEAVKLAPVVRSLGELHDVRVVFTGRHTSVALGEQLLGQFGVDPGERWDTTWPETASAAEQLGPMVTEAARSLSVQCPDAVLVLGATHTVPAFCHAGVAARVPVIHLEAGLRSYDPLSHEEANRRIAASFAALHLAPTLRCAAALRAEGVPDDRIEVVGSPGLDPLRELGVRAVPVEERRGVLITAHRPATVDSEERLAEVVRIVASLVRNVGQVLFPLHPRTADRLREFGLDGALAATGAEIGEPLPYTELLERLRHSRALVTDSGGLQEEAAWLGVPAVVMRRSTPRWEGIEAGVARLSPVRRDAVCRAVAEVTAPGTAPRLSARDCPYGDGRTAERVAAVLGREATWERIRLREPDFTDGRVPAT